MKKEDLTALGISADVADKVLTAHNDALKSYVPKSIFEEKSGELTKAAEGLKAYEKQLEDLKKSAGTSDELKKQIETLQSENKAQGEKHAAELRQYRLDNAVTSALTAAKAKSVKAVRAELDFDFAKAQFDNSGGVVGLNDAIEKLKKADSTAYLFDGGAENKTPAKGSKPAEGADGGGTDDSMRKAFLAAL